MGGVANEIPLEKLGFTEELDLYISY